MPGARKPTAERRGEIANAVLAIVGRGGPKALSTAALAEAVGVTTGALFRHFASMDEILDEAARVAVTRIEATFPGGDLPAIQRLEGLAKARVEVLTKEPGLVWMLRSEQAAHVLPEGAMRRLRGLVRRTRRYLLEALTEATADGTVRSDIPPDALLVPFTATVHAVAAGHPRGSAPAARILDALFRMLRPASGRAARTMR